MKHRPQQRINESAIKVWITRFPGSYALISQLPQYTYKPCHMYTLTFQHFMSVWMVRSLMLPTGARMNNTCAKNEDRQERGKGERETSLFPSATSCAHPVTLSFSSLSFACSSVANLYSIFCFCSFLLIFHRACKFCALWRIGCIHRALDRAAALPARRRRRHT